MITDIIAFVIAFGGIWFLVDQAIRFVRDIKKS